MTTVFERLVYISEGKYYKEKEENPRKVFLPIQSTPKPLKLSA